MAILNEVREQAYAALSTGDHRRALSLALLMQRHFPDDYQTLDLLGKLFLEDRRLGEARSAFSRVLEIDPENVVARAALGMAAEEEGDLDAALEQFERAFDVDPGNREIAAEIARLHACLNHSRPPEPGASMQAMARRFLIESKFESAIPWLQEALRTAPDLTDVAVGLARALWLSWRPREAEDVAREVLAEHPDCLRALAVVAASGLSRRTEETLALLSRTAELNPGNSVARGLFAEAGLVFPEHLENSDIPDSELRDVLDLDDDAPPNPHLTFPPRVPLSTEGEGPSVSDVPAEEVSMPGDDVPYPDLAGEPMVAEQPAQIEPSETVASGAQVTGEQVDLVDGQQTEVAAGDAGGWVPAAVESAADHIAAARRYVEDEKVELALVEYRVALKLDPAVAQTVSEAALALLDAEPNNSPVRWLAGDALTLNGQYRKAVEHYLLVLRRSPESQLFGSSEVHSQD